MNSSRNRVHTRWPRLLSVAFVALFGLILFQSSLVVISVAQPTRVWDLPSPIRDLENLPQPAANLVRFLHDSAIHEYVIEVCSGDALTHQRVIEGALPLRHAAGATHRLVETACALPPDVEFSQPVTDNWIYYRVRRI